MIKREIIEKYGSQLQGMGVNLNCVTKDDLLSILNFRCEHKHSAFTHPKCYRTSAGSKVERIGCIDIETSNLQANFGVMLSWCIKPVGGKVIKDVITAADIRSNKLDKRVVTSCVEELKNYDRIVTHFGTYFDVPFIRTRAVHMGIEFPIYGGLYHTDVWRIAKRKLRLHSNRQGSVAETILGEDIKTRIHPEIWLKVQFGSDEVRKKAIDYLLDHNIKDVVQLEKNYLALRTFVREGKNSI